MMGVIQGDTRSLDYSSYEVVDGGLRALDVLMH